MAAKVEMLSTTDIFDFYGCEFLFQFPGIEESDQKMAEFRLDEVWGKYLTAVRERIKSEMKFLGLDVSGNISIKGMMKLVNDMLKNEIATQAEEMRRTGAGFNMGKMIVQASMAAGRDVGSLAKQFGLAQEKPVKKNTIDTESLIKDPKWHIIAQAFEQLENAKTTKEKILSIDCLNGLQHHSFHLLIDLQTGRMLEDRAEGKKDQSEAMNIVKDVLQIKKDARTPLEFADRMSSDVRGMLTSYRHLMGR
jgi:hypothetical protein